MKANESIRKMAKEKKVPFWKVAQGIGISEPTITRWMRTELPREKEAMIIATICRLANEKEEIIKEKEP